LSQSAGADGSVSEYSAAAGQLFTNHDLNGFVQLDDEQRLIWSGAPSQAIPDAWFDRVHRLLCLSRWSGVDLPPLDLALRQLCGSTLDANALRRIAVLVDLRERTQSTIEALCALVSEIDGSAALGAGDDPEQPASLFDRVFNGDPALLSKRYLRSGSGYVAQAYAGSRELTATGDVLSDLGDNRELRTRIQTALGISAPDLAAVITRFRDRATGRGRVSLLASMDSRGLSRCTGWSGSRSSRICHRLELLRLVDVLEKTRTLRC
jgi:hypothetical protein